MPVWALATPIRKAALQQLNSEAPLWDSDPALTVFSGYHPDNPVTEILNLIPTIKEHHYRLSTLRLMGIESTSPLKEGMEILGYEPISGTTYPGLGYAKPLNRLENVTDILLNADGWQTSNDFYNAFFAAVGAPSWHGHNLDALNDSIATGAINEKEVPYRISIRNAGDVGDDAAVFIKRIQGLIQKLQSNGCPVEMVIERS